MWPNFVSDLLITADQESIQCVEIITLHQRECYKHRPQPSPGGIVDHGVLQQRPEHEEHAHPGPDVDSLAGGDV